METGSQILQYVGDKNLGSGSNASIPVINPNNNLDVINNAANNISMLNHDDNIKLYNQKIQDRDTALQMLQQGQIASGAIDDSDRPFYDEAKKAASDQFYNMMQNGGINNTDAYRKYLDKSKELANVVTQAQGRNLEMAKLNQERSQQALPQDQQDYDAHIKAQQAKPFWQPIDPYQKAFNYDLPSLTSDVSGQPSTVGQLGSPNVSAQQNATTKWNSTTNKNGVITQKETTKTSPTKTGLVNNKTAKQPITISGQQVGADGQLNPYSYTPEKYYDLGSIQKNVDENYATDPEKRFAYQSYFNDFQDPNKLPPPEQKKTIEAYNNRIADYSNQRGIQPIQGQFNPDGSPTYPNQIKYNQNTDGSVIVQETPASFFAKHALASINGDYVEKPQRVVDLKTAEYNLKANESKAKIGALRALENQRNASARLTNKKSTAVDTQFNPQQVYDELFKGKMDTYKTTEGNMVTRVRASDMSKELQKTLDIDPLNPNGDYNLVPSNIKVGNKLIDESLIQKGYPNWLKSDDAKKIEKAKGKPPSIFDFIYSQGGNFEVEVQGKSKPSTDKNGAPMDDGGKIVRSNRLQSFINQMNKGGVKGKELVKLLSDGDSQDSETPDEAATTNVNQ
ncbi:MAG: hypothetical protein ABI091_26740 [Ferruginibacter sp.]